MASVTAVAWVPSVAQELPHATGVPPPKKSGRHKKEKGTEKQEEQERRRDKERERTKAFWHRLTSQHFLEETRLALNLALSVFSPKGLVQPPWMFPNYLCNSLTKGVWSQMAALANIGSQDENPLGFL